MESEISALFFRRAAIMGDAPLFYGASALSWRQAAAEVKELAGRFAAESLPLVLSGRNSHQVIITFIAARHAGRMAVLVDELSTERAGLTLGALLGAFRHYDCAGRRPEQVYGDGPQTEIPCDAAFSLLTSGSTGDPKLVLRTEQSILDEGGRYASRYGWHEKDVILCALPLTHAFMFGLAMGGGVGRGCSLHVLPVPNPPRIIETIAEGRVTVLPLVPSLARLVCRVLEVKGAQLKNAALRSIIVGAGPMCKELHEALAKRLGIAPASNYGCTEMGTLLGSLPGECVPESAGTPFDGVEVYIRSALNSSGMLFVRTKSPFVGYLTGDGVDTGKISPDGWYCTEDLAETANGGAITVQRRFGGAIRRAGRFIHPHEVIRAIESHPDVQEAAVAEEDGLDGEPVVAAWVQTRPGTALDVAAMRGHMARLLEDHKIPVRWHISNSIPRTSSGKALATPLPRHSADLGGMLEMITAYRKAAALWWAEEAGLFEKTDGHEGDANIARGVSSGNRHGEKMLASVLSSCGICRNGAGASSLLPHNESVFRYDFLKFENAFFRLLAGEESNPLKHGAGAKRPLDGPAITPLYERLMSHAGRKAALHAARGEWLKSGAVLEIGNPAGMLAPLLNRGGTQRCKAYGVGYLNGTSERAGTYEAIYLFNTVRRLVLDNDGAGLGVLAGLLKEGGHLAVADILIDTPGAYARFKPFFQVDWLIQREWCCATLDELAAACGRFGLVHRQTSDVDGLYSLSVFKK